MGRQHLGSRRAPLSRGVNEAQGKSLVAISISIPGRRNRRAKAPGPLCAWSVRNSKPARVARSERGQEEEEDMEMEGHGGHPCRASGAVVDAGLISSVGVTLPAGREQRLTGKAENRPREARRTPGTDVLRDTGSRC